MTEARVYFRPLWLKCDLCGGLVGWAPDRERVPPWAQREMIEDHKLTDCTAQTGAKWLAREHAESMGERLVRRWASKHA